MLFQALHLSTRPYGLMSIRPYLQLSECFTRLSLVVHSHWVDVMRILSTSADESFCY
jgi:hypothetical protein